MDIKLKLKYRQAHGKVRNGPYRSRTGPNCCNANCAKRRRQLTFTIPAAGKR